MVEPARASDAPSLDALSCEKKNRFGCPGWSITDTRCVRVVCNAPCGKKTRRPKRENLWFLLLRQKQVLRSKTHNGILPFCSAVGIIFGAEGRHGRAGTSHGSRGNAKVRSNTFVVTPYGTFYLHTHRWFGAQRTAVCTDSR